jgi:hypothetical protein
MESLIDFTKIKKPVVKEEYTEFKKGDSSFWQEIYEKHSKEDISVVDNSNIINKHDFFRRGFLSGETWDKTLNIQSRILSSTKDTVTCECLIDKEQKTFQIRSFPIQLFEHLKPIIPKKTVLVKIKTKIGSSRIDVYDGKHLVDNHLFELKDNWELLKNSNLNSPLEL